MNPSTPNDLTQAVLARLEGASDPRFAQIMRSLIQHLHAFLIDVDLKPDEWIKTIEFLTAVGQKCDDKRQEFILLSDTLGASMMVVMLDEMRAAAKNKGTHRATAATEATVQGPFHWAGSPEMPLGADIRGGASGEPAYYSGRITDTHGKPIAGALLDIWSGDGDGFYDMQKEGSPMFARARIKADAQGRYWFWSLKPTYYPVPTDGPVGRMLDGMGRHPNRPGHIHMIVSAPQHVSLTTHLFVANSPFLDSDAVFGVRPSLIVDFKSHAAGTAPDGRELETSYWSADYDFCLETQAA